MPFGLKKRRYLKTSWIREKQWSSMTKVSYVHLRSPNFKLFHMLSIPLPPPSLERCFKMYPFLNSTYPLPFPLVLPTILSHCNYYYFDHIFASNYLSFTNSKSNPCSLSFISSSLFSNNNLP